MNFGAYRATHEPSHVALSRPLRVSVTAKEKEAWRG